MTCPTKTDENAELLLAYSARNLDAARAAIVERHVETCAECARFVAAQQRVWNALDTWDARNVPPVSANFDGRLHERIDAARSAPWYRQFAAWIAPARWSPAFPLAAACTVIVTAFLLHQPGSLKTAPVNPDVLQVSPSDAEQVEATLDDLQMLNQLQMASQDTEKHSKSI